MSQERITGWELKSSTGSHFDVLDGIRGVAMLMVAVYHTFYVNPGGGTTTRVVAGIIGTGWLGVPIFFVLSGFLISYPFFKGKAKDERFWYQDGYARRRLGKILPPFYLSIIIFTAYFFLRYGNATYIATGLKWALGLPNFILTSDQMNSPWWSLIVEAQFYAVLPLLFLLTKSVKSLHAGIILFIALLTVPMAIRQCTFPDNQPLYIYHFVLHRFPCDFDFFAWGILFSSFYVSLSPLLKQTSRLSLLGYAGIALLAITILLCAYWTELFDVAKNPVRWSVEALHILPALSAFLLLFFVFDGKRLGARLLSHPWLRFVGIVSYEWYLFHKPVVDFWAQWYGQVHGSVPNYLLKTIVPLVITFLFSVMVYRYFSLPLLKRIRSTPKEVKPVRAPASVASIR